MIRKAEIKDIPEIMKFIDEYWKKEHILARDVNIFKFQYLWGEEVSFVLSFDDSNSINAILGFIPYGTEKKDVTLAVWKSIPGSGDVMLGIHLIENLLNDRTIRSISCPGINPKTMHIYDFLGFQTGQMKHWYRLSKKDTFEIGKISNAGIPQAIHDDKLSFKLIKSFDEAAEFGVGLLAENNVKPFKSMEYIERRYFNHPSYDYLIYGLEIKEKKLITVFRIQEYGDSRIIRHIDSIGSDNVLMYCGDFIDKLLKKYEAEYIDMYETGVDRDILIKGGWADVNESDNIIPEYFSPFEQKNIDIYYCSQIKNVILYKGDGDMDRPN